MEIYRQGGGEGESNNKKLRKKQAKFKQGEVGVVKKIKQSYVIE